VRRAAPRRARRHRQNDNHQRRKLSQAEHSLLGYPTGILKTHATPSPFCQA